MKTQNLLKECKKALEYRIRVCKAAACTDLHPCRACKSDQKLIDKIVERKNED